MPRPWLGSTTSLTAPLMAPLNCPFTKFRSADTGASSE